MMRPCYVLPVAYLPLTIACLQLNFARNYLPELLPEVGGRVVYMDVDAIVLGDIAELAATAMEPGYAIAASSDCNPLFRRIGVFAVCT